MNLRTAMAMLAGFALTATTAPFVASPASANAAGTGLVISEVYGGGGNSGATYTADFIELYNPTAAAISLNGMSLQYRSQAGSSASVLALPNVSVAAGDHFLAQVSNTGANGADLSSAATVDFVGTSLNMSGTNGQAILASGTSQITATGHAMQNVADVIDFVGYGTAANVQSSETAPTGTALTNATSAQRLIDGVDTDSNLADFTRATPTPMGSGDGGGPAALSLTNPGNRAFAVDTAITPFSLAATGGGSPYTYASTALPTGLSLNASTGEISGTPTVLGSTNVTATVTDSAEPAASDSATFTITVSEEGAVIPIATVQGTGERSSYAPATGTNLGDQVTVRGVVTSVLSRGFAASGAANCGYCGFYIQTAGTGGSVPDETPGASDAVFVYGGGGFEGTYADSTAIEVGDSVEVIGKVSEYNNLTEINAYGTNGTVTELSESLGVVTPQTTIPVAAEREAHEGELFNPTDLVITDVYNFESSGEFGVATGGEVLMQPGEVCVGDETEAACVAAVQQDTADRGLFLDDGTSTAFLNSSTYYYPNNSNNSDIPLPYISKTRSARVGAGVTFTTGAVLDQRSSKWYLQPPRTVLAAGHEAASADLGEDVVNFEDTRADNATPADVGGDLKIATYNVENYFTLTAKEFADKNPYYSCQFNTDRDGNQVAVYQCTSPTAVPSAWDPVTGAATAYTSGTVSAPRGAARQEDLDRQTAKIVSALNTMDADIVSLQEMANPNKLRLGVTNSPLDPDPSKADSGLGTAMAWRDESVAYLVGKLNEALGEEAWDYVISPDESLNNTSVQGMCATVNPNGTPTSPTDSNLAYLRGTCSWASGQDVIRSAFIYKSDAVVPVGPARLDLPGNSAPVPSPFDNAREPFAQYFKPVGYPNSEGFLVLASHFKSKGDSDSPYGPAIGGDANSALHGAFNATRVKQAEEMTRFANELASEYGTDKVFMLGDFNSYTAEDPVQAVLNYEDDDLDFDIVESEDESDLTYVYTSTVGGVGYGAVGSIDHVFASAGAREMITGADVWEINANEPGAYNYSRYNANKTDFWDGDQPFGGSDHNPEIIGIELEPNTDPVTDVQIIGSNDFHGRLLGSSSDGGAAQLAEGVNQLKQLYGEDNSVFVAAGDLIGASTFESFVAHDKPTLDALNAAGLEVSAVGNHEFDQGYEDLLERVMQPYDEVSNPYGADGGLNWEYIGANVVYTEDPDGSGPIEVGDTLVLPTWSKDVGGVEISFVGAVTEDLMGLVSPSGMNGVGVEPIVDTVNAYATSLRNSGSDLVVLLVHEGSSTTSCDTMTSNGTSFADLLNGLNGDVDAVVSGHTHLKYACEFEVPEWSDRAVSTRPVVSAGQYGIALDQIVYSFNSDGDAVDLLVNNVTVKGDDGALFAFGEDPDVKTIVDDAVEAAEGPGSAVLGQIDNKLERAKLTNGVTENRGGESTLGNQVAEIQRWATSGAEAGSAEIAFMNPGGLRADLVGTGANYPKDVTYKEAAAVQPFANTLINMKLTGAQIRTVLEQQWQRDANGNMPSRPFLRLGTSAGFTYTYYETNDPSISGAKVGHVTGMWLNGVPLEDSTTYSVTVNSFLAAGGDNFWELANGVDRKDTAITDLQAQVDYMANIGSSPLQVDYSQHAVGVTFPSGAPATYNQGDTVSFDLSSLDMTAPDSVKDSTLTVSLDGTTLGTATVTHSNGTSPHDEYGTASVSVALPAYLDTGDVELVITGNATGTQIRVPLSVTGTGIPDKEPSTVGAANVQTYFGQNGTLTVNVTPATAGGTVAVTIDGSSAGTYPVSGGVATVPLSATGVGVGPHTIGLSYSGDLTTEPSTGSATWTVVALEASTVTADDVSTVYGANGSLQVTVTPATATGTLTVLVDGESIGDFPVTAGSATVPLSGAGVKAGSHSIGLSYSGDDATAASAGTATWTVAKKTVKLKVKVAPKKVKVGAVGKVTVTVPKAVKGKVKVKVGAKTYTAKIKKGKATIKLAKFAKLGSYKAKATLVAPNHKAKAKKFTVKVIKK